MIRRCLIYCLIVAISFANKKHISSSIQIKDFKISKCDTHLYPILVDNVSIELGVKPKVKVTGSLFTQVDITSPMKASVSLERDELGIWIPVPCIYNLGSCTYYDLCSYGYPTNTTCPEVFIKNNVPCRCPIAKGNYTIAPTASLELPELTSIYSGTYKGVVKVTENNQFLSCYKVYFVLYDELIYDNNLLYSVSVV